MADIPFTPIQWVDKETAAGPPYLNAQTLNAREAKLKELVDQINALTGGAGATQLALAAKADLDGSGKVPDGQIPAAIARDSEVSDAIAALPFRANNTDQTGAAPGGIPTATQVTDPNTPGAKVTQWAVLPAPVSDLPEVSRTAADGTPANLLGKTTRYANTTDVAQLAPPAVPGAVMAVGRESGAAALSLTGATQSGTQDKFGAGTDTVFAFAADTELRTFHCTTAGRWRVASGSTGQAALDARANALTQARGLTGADKLRAMIRTGQVTTDRPIVPIGDSHTDNTTSAQYIWTRLKNVRTQLGEGLEGVPAAAIVPRGNNGQTLADYLAGNGTNNLAGTLALNPSVILACWLTNDVRQGGLGLTVPAIRAAGAARLTALITKIKAAVPDVLIVLRVPATYLTENTGNANYINDGAGNVNPAGLAQTYNDGVRAAHYDVARAHGDVLIYDPQTRLFGTTCPGTADVHLANQIHQSQQGYEVEGDDFAAWVAAALPFAPSRSTVARAAAPAAPWTAYHRDVEDPGRYVLVGKGQLVSQGASFVDIGPNGADIAPGNLARFDIIEFLAAGASFVIPSGSTISASGNNTRIALAGGATIPTNTAVAGAQMRVYRRAGGSDAAVNAVLNDTSWRYKRVGRVLAGNTTYLDVDAASVTAARATQPAGEWATTTVSGDKVYIEGQGGAPITLTSNFAASGNNLRLTGLSGIDWSAYVGQLVVLVGTHA